MLTRIGKCNHCGACCYVYNSSLKDYALCSAYTTSNQNGHCSLYDTRKRPKECAEFPRDPADLERVQKWCSFQFIDEKGKIVTGLVNIYGKPVKLTLASPPQT